MKLVALLHPEFASKPCHYSSRNLCPLASKTSKKALDDQHENQSKRAKTTSHNQSKFD